MINLRLDFYGWKPTSLSLVTHQAVSPECKCRRVGSSYELRGPRYRELTISMAECEGLVLAILARIEK